MAKGRIRQRQYRHVSDQEVSDAFARAAERLDNATRMVREGKLTTGECLTRPYHGRPMLVGALLTGFGGNWITQGSCYSCGSPDDTARCSQCPCGICQEHGVLIARAGQTVDSSEWQGSSIACCSDSHACEQRQQQIAEFWKQKTGDAEVQ